MRWRVLFVVVVATTAGCSAIDGGAADPSTVTPVPVPDEAPESGPGATVVPGVWADGRVDIGLLADAQAAVLANRSFRWRAERNWTGTVGNVTSSAETYDEIALENETRFSRDATMFLTHPKDAFYARYSQYANGSVQFARAQSYSWWRARYDRSPVVPNRDRIVRSTTAAVQRYLTVETVRVDRVSVEGKTMYRLVGRNATGLGGSMMENYSVRAHVRPDGLVRNLTASYTTVQAGSTEHVRYRFTFSQIGTVTVRQPPWVETARSRHENGTTRPIQ
ncbi:hypothetical protein [Halorhabdus sp. CUG00001]|uniref:DUF7537 family lipoprotein n=1 Tax=Halorhabdus sp. CUG00001 TaxID=2600297 RepID=UPI00131AE2BE|nr:hypothetical protein [Halorhabdus sp. CUG00001]